MEKEAFKSRDAWRRKLEIKNPVRDWCKTNDLMLFVLIKVSRTVSSDHPIFLN